MCRVLNKHHAGAKMAESEDTGGVYIGRGSKWGNPFRIGLDGDRAAVIAKYERWLADQHHLLRALDELRGRDLVCFCAPRPCHGDLLLRLANATRDERIAWWRAASLTAALDQPVPEAARESARNGKRLYEEFSNPGIQIWPADLVPEKFKQLLELLYKGHSYRWVALVPDSIRDQLQEKYGTDWLPDWIRNKDFGEKIRFVSATESSVLVVGYENPLL